MNGDLALWNYGLLFAALIVVLGVAGIVASTGLASRWLSSGLVLQGIVLTFAAGVTYFPGSVDLRLGGFTVACLLLIQHFLMPSPEPDRSSENKSSST